ncbi:MAG: hypothetical protein ACI90V_007771 [Bacillariaceae sp.]|jgi:hypothetical protein
MLTYFILREKMEKRLYYVIRFGATVPSTDEINNNGKATHYYDIILLISTIRKYKYTTIQQQNEQTTKKGKYP